MIAFPWSQSKSRGRPAAPAVAHGARPSANIASSAEGSLPFKCARVLSISPVVRHSLFNASNDFDLPHAALAGLNIDIPKVVPLTG